MRYLLSFCLPLLLPLLSSLTLTPPSHLQSNRQVLIVPSSPTTSQIFSISFSKTYPNETRMLTYGIDQYQTDTLFTQSFQTDLISHTAYSFMLNVSTLSSITIKGFAIRYMVTQNEPNLYNQYYYATVGTTNSFWIGSGYRQDIFYLDAPISFYSSNHTIILPFIQGYKMNSTSHVIRIATRNPRIYLDKYKYQQEFITTTDQDCKISYFSFNILFVNVEEMQREGYYVAGGHHVVFNETSGVSSFGYAIMEQGNTTMLIGVNGFGTAEKRSIRWDVTVDANGTGLVLQKQNIDQIYYSFVQIGLIVADAVVPTPTNTTSNTTTTPTNTTSNTTTTNTTSNTTTNNTTSNTTTNTNTTANTTTNTTTTNTTTTNPNSSTFINTTNPQASTTTHTIYLQSSNMPYIIIIVLLIVALILVFICFALKCQRKRSNNQVTNSERNSQIGVPNPINDSIGYIPHDKEIKASNDFTPNKTSRTAYKQPRYLEAQPKELHEQPDTSEHKTSKFQQRTRKQSTNSCEIYSIE